MSTYVVVGAIGNIGLAFVKALAENKANTVIGINRREPNEAISGVHDKRADLGDLSSLRRAAEEIDTIAKNGVDVLISVAGFGQTWNPSVGKGEEEELGRQLSEAFAINTVGILQLISLLLPALRRGREKKIVYLTSANGVVPFVQKSKLPSRLPYATSRAATNMGILAIANQLHPEGFTCFAISPSLVHDAESLRKNGQDPAALEARVRSLIPGHEGLVHPNDAVKIMLGVIERFGPEDSGRIVGMWGSEDRW